MIAAVEVCSYMEEAPKGAAEEGAVRDRRSRRAAGPLLGLCPQRVVYRLDGFEELLKIKLRFKCPKLLKRTCSMFVCLCVCVCCCILNSTI